MLNVVSFARRSWYPEYCWNVIVLVFQLSNMSIWRAADSAIELALKKEASNELCVTLYTLRYFVLACAQCYPSAEPDRIMGPRVALPRLSKWACPHSQPGNLCMNDHEKHRTFVLDFHIFFDSFSYENNTYRLRCIILKHFWGMSAYLETSLTHAFRPIFTKVGWQYQPNHLKILWGITPTFVGADNATGTHWSFLIWHNNGLFYRRRRKRMRAVKERLRIAQQR